MKGILITVLMFSTVFGYSQIPTVSRLGVQNIVLDSIWKRVGVVFNSTTTAEGNNTYEPSVIYEGSPQILTNYTKVFKMWYTSGWGTVSRAVNYAESVDGITWTHYASNPIVTAHSRSFVLKNGSTYYMYAANSASTAIDRYTSSNGVSWTLATANVITGSNVYNSSVIIDGGTWKMLLDGYGVGSGYVENYYTSPDGITWTAYGSNPVISGHGGGSPMLKKVGNTYYCWLGNTGGTAVLPTDIYRYSSPDMITWTMTTNATFPRRQLDEGANNALGQVQDIYITEVDSSLYMFYAASPNGNDSAARQQIKLAIADASFYKITQTQEGDGGGVIKATTFLALDSANIYYDRGSVAIGGSTPNSKAILDLQSTTKVLLPPRLTTTQQNAISSPPAGSFIYNSTLGVPAFNNGSSWISLGAGWSTVGNAGVDSTNFLGTTDLKPLVFKINNVINGQLSDSIINNVVFGYRALELAPLVSHTGQLNSNVAIGGYASQKQKHGTENVAIGSNALKLDTLTSQNVAIGSLALSSLLNGTGHNTAIGWSAMTSSTSGNLNVAIGYEALKSNTTGYENVAIGNGAMRNGTSGAARNTAVGGATALPLDGGSNNSAFGYGAGSSLTTTYYNTALGSYALASNSTSQNNTALGGLALYAGTGSNSLGVGYLAGRYTTATTNLLFINSLDRTDATGDSTNSIIYGVQSTTAASQRLKLGGGGTVGINQYGTSTLAVNGSFATGYVAKATSYTATISDNVIEVTATGQTITLPTAVGCQGRYYTIKLTASGSSTVATTSSQTIDGVTTYSLSAQYKYVTVQSNNANWIIIANN